MTRLKTAAAERVAAMLAVTWRVRFAGRDHVQALRAAGTPFIYALWHSQILPLLWYHRGSGTTLVVSGHRDGGLLAGAAASWGFGVVRGSSTRGGLSAVRGAVRALGEGRVVAITPDGPRGPANSVKPGILKVAELSGAPIVPVVAKVHGAWRLGSWDRFVVPAPFASVEIEYMPPISVARGRLSDEVRDELKMALGAGAE